MSLAIVWDWLRKNSPILQGIAATIVILAGLAAVPRYLKRFLTPELVLRIDEEWDAAPPDLTEWAQRTASWMGLLSQSYSAQDVGEIPWNSLLRCPASLRNSSLTAPLGTIHYFLDSFWNNLQQSNSSVVARRLQGGLEISRLGVLRLELRNESDHEISGIRLRVDRVLDLWDTQITGDFLTAQEVTRFRQQLQPLHGESLVLPELPTLPPNAGLSITIYGNGVLSEPTVSVTGARCEIIRLAKVEDTGVIDWYLHPYKLLIPVVVLFWMLVFILPKTAFTLRQRTISHATPAILRDLARRHARDGQGDQAVALLRDAFDSGYSDKSGVLKDPDFESLRQRADFRALTGG